jgi:hypothetical protein
MSFFPKVCCDLHNQTPFANHKICILQAIFYLMMIVYYLVNMDMDMTALANTMQGADRWTDKKSNTYFKTEQSKIHFYLSCINPNPGCRA